MPNAEYVRATVRYYGMIPFLGIQGPILRPYRMSKAIYERLLANGFKVKLVSTDAPVEKETPKVDVEITQEVPEATYDETENTAVDTAEDVEETEDDETTVTPDEETIDEDPEDTTEDDEVQEDVVEEDEETSDDEGDVASEDDEPANATYSEEELEGLTKAELKAILKENGVNITKNLTLDALKKRVLAL